jgi:lysozyme family protein
MADFHLAIPTLLRHEGGYVNDPDDGGGATKFGICQRSYPHLDIASLNVDDAKAIYERDFWKPLLLDRVNSQAVATKVLDTAVLIGKTRAVEFLQRSVQEAGGGIVLVDGKMGKDTLMAINMSSPDLLLGAFRRLLATYYENLATQVPGNRKFLKGWLQRAVA